MALIGELLARARSAPGGKFRRDALWNFGSIGVLALAGYVLNLKIGRDWGSAPLGVFNQVMAAYIFLSQAAVGGVDRSVLRAVAAARGDRDLVRAILAGALPPTLALAALFGFAFWASRGLVAELLGTPGIADGIEVAAPGLFFFALNKVGMAAVNAAQRMRAFAVYTALRYALMVAGLYCAGGLGLDSNRLAFLFTFAEALLFVPLAIEVALQLRGGRAARAWTWSGKHLRYGVKSAGSGMLLELNSRVDVLMLGYFLAEDSPVGVYSFAAFVAEGVFQLIVVLQNNYNPLLAQKLAGGEIAELERVVARGRRATYAFMTAVCAAAVAGFPIFLWLLEKPEFAAGWLPFGCLMLGMALSSGYQPFGQILLMANHPAWHTLFIASVVACNVAFNALLIPRFGLVGAAVATAIAIVYSMAALRLLVARLLRVRL
jgi:O-antigen/teichoic acid export membrane protein